MWLFKRNTRQGQEKHHSDLVGTCLNRHSVGCVIFSDLKMSLADPFPNRTLLGIGYALIGFSIFSIQDATVKWLVATLPVWQVLFSRSILIVVLCLFLLGPQRAVELARGSSRTQLLIRSSLILMAWLAYFTASRSLHLTEMVTIYFSTPIFAVIMSIFILKETVGFARWAATIIGFIGVIIAAGPAGSTDFIPVLLVLFAALCWAATNVLVRLIGRKEGSLSLMLASNAIVALVCSVTLPFVWITPSLNEILLILMLGVVGASGQYFMFEGYRLAPASAVAPFEYITLIWAFGWGFLIWGDFPPLPVFIGAALILASGFGLVIVEALTERRRRIA
jgi:S-adenosylmethionine uptake transporter